MSAQLQRTNQEPAASLSDSLVIYDQLPDDFYKNTKKYKAQLDVALELAKGLVHPLDDEGRKTAGKDAALLRRYAGNTKKFSLSVFRILTDKAKTWRDDIDGKAKAIEQTADEIITRFEAQERAKLDGIRTLLVNTLRDEWTANNVDDEFRWGDVEPLVKLSGTLTDTGALTKKAHDFISQTVAANLAKQHKTESRLLELENRCLRHEINPPLARVHVEAVLFSDDAVFSEKVDKLIAAEVLRREEFEENLRKKEETRRLLEAKQKEREEVAKKMAEGIQNARAAISNAEQTQAIAKEVAQEMDQNRNWTGSSNAQSPNDNRTAKWSINDTVMNRKPAPIVEQEIVKPATLGKRTVQVTCVFTFENIGERVSTRGVIDHLLKLLPDKLRNVVESAVGVDL
jgi:hypothetical protein